LYRQFLPIEVVRVLPLIRSISGVLAMKLALSALFACALLAGPAGCCLFPCSSAFDGCGAGGCGLDGCGLDDCGQCGCQAEGYPASGCQGCEAMGCSRRLHIFNWSRCCDKCDQCGQWTGEGFVSQKGGWPGRGYAAAPPSYDEPAPEMEMMTTGDMPSGKIVPGSMRVTTRQVEPPVLESEEPIAVRRPKAISASSRPAKRITSSKK
jgi:hypothetical protein